MSASVNVDSWTGKVRNKHATASCVDVYARDSASGFEQDFEIGIQLELPDGSTKEFEVLHDQEIPDTNLLSVLSYVGVAGIGDLDTSEEIQKHLEELTHMHTEIPLLYNSNSDEWEIHLPDSESVVSTGMFTASRKIGFNFNPKTICIERHFEYGPYHPKSPYYYHNNKCHHGPNDSVTFSVSAWEELLTEHKD